MKMIVIAFTIIFTVILFGSNHSASAATPNELTTKIWITATDSKGNEKTIAQEEVDPNGQFDRTSNLINNIQPINTHEYSNFVEHYSIVNKTGNNLHIEPILELPWAFDTIQGIPTLVNDSSRHITITSPTESPFTLAYSYSDNANQYTSVYKQSEKLSDIACVGPVDDVNSPLSYQSFANNASLQLDVPLKVAKNTDWPDEETHQALTIDQLYVREEGKTNPGISLVLLPIRTMEAHDFNSANLNTLKDEDQYKGLTHLYKSDGSETNIHDAAVKIEPTNVWNQYQVTYTYDGVSKSVIATIGDKSYIDAKDFTVGYGSDWNSQKFNGITSLKDTNGNSIKPSDSNVSISITDSKNNSVQSIDTNNAGAVYTVTYKANGATKVVHVTVGQRGYTPSNNGGNSSNNSNNNGGNSGNNAWNPSTPSNPNGTGLPNYAAVKGSAVFANKRVYMYRHADFKKSERIATYPKSKRANNAMFVVLDYARSANGALRYKVRDVNHHSKTDGKIGYITANPKYVVNVYYKTMPKNGKITVINKKGIHAYKHANLTGRVKTFKKGTHITVKSFVKHNLTTRYKLSNGT